MYWVMVFAVEVRGQLGQPRLPRRPGQDVRNGPSSRALPTDDSFAFTIFCQPSTCPVSSPVTNSAQ